MREKKIWTLRTILHSLLSESSKLRRWSTLLRVQKNYLEMPTSQKFKSGFQGKGRSKLSLLPRRFQVKGSRLNNSQEGFKIMETEKIRAIESSLISFCLRNRSREPLVRQFFDDRRTFLFSFSFFVNAIKPLVI